METVKKIFAVVLVFAVVFPLVFTGCSSENSDDVVQTSGLSDAEREEFIQTKIIGDGKVLLEEDMTLVNDIATARLIWLKYCQIMILTCLLIFPRQL